MVEPAEATSETDVVGTCTCEVDVLNVIVISLRIVVGDGRTVIVTITGLSVPLEEVGTLAEPVAVDDPAVVDTAPEKLTAVPPSILAANTGS